ncbi:stage V sporulation protein E [Haloplasma contractile]|uniref:Cell division protein ftsW n=1 Tax=Haloplasma contractile SSD-17B TaxID=1033810 RepID=F7Q1C1_9MOLU|nr:stage V sporulation protein E [Haloplasma contractile]ERJ12837.1 Cell division protein ftsW [Haloplasma contractile SSD-17B]
MEKNKRMNLKILFTTLLLVTIGTIMVYSSSMIWSEYKFNDRQFYLWRQLIFASAGILGMILVANIDYRLYKKHATKLFVVTLILLILVLIPGVGMVRGGARSWIGIGSFSIQPSEFMKIAIVVLVSKYLSDHYKDVEKTKYILFLLATILFVFGIIMLQPDFGTGMVVVATCVIILFVAGVNIKYFFYMALMGAGGIALLIISAPYRLKRIFAYLDPWSDPLGAGFQIIQSLYAIAPGGLFGVGLFNSRQKYFYLPEPQTDFIFAITVEELGFIGAAIIICLYTWFFIECLKTSISAKDLFGKFLSLGITAIIFIQVFINIGVVIGLLPVTGVTLPFLSYGGSSLTVTLLGVGIILNISRDKVNVYLE